MQISAQGLYAVYGACQKKNLKQIKNKWKKSFDAVQKLKFQLEFISTRTWFLQLFITKRLHFVAIGSKATLTENTNNRY